MANGDIKLLDFRQFRALLLDGQSASHSGIWVEIPPGFPIRSFETTSLEEGAVDATIDIMVSNAEAKPADATDGPVTQTLNTTTTAASKQEGYRWIKAKKTAGTTPVGTTVTLVATKSD